MRTVRSLPGNSLPWLLFGRQIAQVMDPNVNASPLPDRTARERIAQDLDTNLLVEALPRWGISNLGDEHGPSRYANRETPHGVLCLCGPHAVQPPHTTRGGNVSRGLSVHLGYGH